MQRQADWKQSRYDARVNGHGCGSIPQPVSADYHIPAYTAPLRFKLHPHLLSDNQWQTSPYRPNMRR